MSIPILCTRHQCTPFPRCPSSSHQQAHPKRSPYKAHIQPSIPPKNIVPPKPHQNAIPFGLLLRIRRRCSTYTFFDQQSRELIEYLTKRGYSRSSLKRDANRARSITRHATLQSPEQKSAKTDRTP